MAIVFLVFVFLLVFIIYRWEVIGDMIENRKPDYEYISWLETKTIEEVQPGLHHFHGLKGKGITYTVDVLSCRECNIPDFDKYDIYPCDKHVLLFND